MYGCFDPVVVFGFAELDRNQVINPDFLAQFAPSDDLDIYALDVVRVHMGNAVYGVQARMRADGKCSVTREDRAIIKKLYAAASKTKKYGAIRYHVVIRGDYDTKEHKRYTPGEE